MSDEATRLAIAEVKIDQIEEAVKAIRTNTDKMVEFAQAMTRLDEKHINLTAALGRCFKEIEKEGKERVAACVGMDIRLEKVESEMPTLLLVRGWAFAILAWAASMSGGLIWLIIMELSKHAE